jgi:hypothetical protein
MDLKNSFSVCSFAGLDGRLATGLQEVDVIDTEIAGKAMEKLKRIKAQKKNLKKSKKSFP